MSGRWRDYAAPIIARVIEEVGRDDMKKLRAALRAAYPFGKRKQFPYKVWCDEVRIQLLGLTGKKAEVLPGQKGLFDAN